MLSTPIKLSVRVLINSFYINVDERNLIRSLSIITKGELSIMGSGSLVGGESYTLECSAGASEGTFQWVKGSHDSRTPVVTDSSITISSTSTTSQLQFRPIQQSNNGSYFCNATIGGVTLFSEPVVIRVNGIINIMPNML